MLKTDRIRARIREIQSALAADHGRDMDVLLGKLEIVYRRAIEDHHFYAAARAVELQAKLAASSVPIRSGPVINQPPGLKRPACRQKPTKTDKSLQSDRNLP